MGIHLFDVLIAACFMAAGAVALWVMARIK
jgi:hypothetical protein